MSPLERATHSKDTHAQRSQESQHRGSPETYALAIDNRLLFLLDSVLTLKCAIELIQAIVGIFSDFSSVAVFSYYVIRNRVQEASKSFIVQYSLDGSTAPTGGDLDWVSRGDLLQPEVEDAIFALEPGQISPEPVKSSLGYHIVQVLEKVEDRPLSQAALAEKQQQAFMAWLDSQRQAAVIERYVGSQ